MAEVEPRITGSEIEYPIMRAVPSETDPELTKFVQVTNAEFLPKVTHYMKSVPHAAAYLGADPSRVPTDYFLSNGARTYGDIGDHWEYATAEDDSLEGMVANEFAGERIMEAIISNDAAPELGELRLHKRVVSDNGETCASHESYGSQNPNLEISMKGLELAAVHYATRSFFTGVGYLDKKGRYFAAQKARRLNTTYASAAHGKSEPVVNLRDEPLADSETGWRRAHVTCGDGNMSPWSIKMKHGTTDLVIRILEEGETMPDLRFEQDAFIVARNVAADTRFQALHKLKNGEVVSTIEVSRRLLMQVMDFANNGLKLPPDAEWVMEEWAKICHDAEKNPDASEVVRRLEWKLKLSAITKFKDAHGLGWRNARLRHKERQWDFIGAKSLGYAMRERAWSEWMPSESLITARMTTPPDNTRAKLRGEFISKAYGHGSLQAGWQSVQLGTKSTTLIDPRATSDEKVARILGSIRDRDDTEDAA